jgi:peptide/nickel transport system substrate-binding protein
MTPLNRGREWCTSSGKGPSVVRCTHLAGTLLGGAALAMVVLVAASARPQLHAKYGGTLYVGVGNGEPDALDPTLSRTFSAVEVFRTFCERLYDFDGNARIVPQLAVALPTISRDKRTYTIPLRKGIEFNDGTPFDAQSVVTTLERDITLPGSARASDFPPIAGIYANDPYTVVIHLAAPFTPLTQLLATNDGIIMSPAQLTKLGTNFASDPVCVGPFMYDNRVAGASITVIKSPYYYDQGAVHLDKIVFEVENDAAAAAAALKAGDLQVLDNVSTTQLPGIQQTSNLQVIPRESFGWNGVTFNVGNKNGVGSFPYGGVNMPFAVDARLRKAFAEAIDRATLAKVVFSGDVQPGCTPIPPASTVYDSSLPCTPYDPRDARRLVAASGVANPTVHLLTPNTSDSLRLAQFIQAEEAVVGVSVVIDSTDLATAVAQATSGNFEAYLDSFSGSADIDKDIFQFVDTSGANDRSGYSNPRLDLILNNSRKAQTPAALKALYRAAVQMLLSDRPIVFLYHPIKYAAVSSAVTGVQFYFDAQLRLGFAQLR